MGDPKCIPAFPGHLEAANKRINQLNSNQTEPPADKTPAQLAHSSSASSSVERMRAISMMSSMMLITPSSLVEHLEEGPQRALLHRHRPVRLPQRAQQLVDGAVGLGLLGLVDQQPLQLLLHQEESAIVGRDAGKAPAQCRAPRLVRLFVYSIPPPARLSAVIGHRVTRESIWGLGSPWV